MLNHLAEYLHPSHQILGQLAVEEAEALRRSHYANYIQEIFLYIMAWQATYLSVLQGISTKSLSLHIQQIPFPQHTYFVIVMYPQQYLAWL